MDKIKATFIAIFTALSAWLGILAVPVLLLVGCNIIDYGTGLAAAKYRNQKISSYVGFRGIAKKICMWLLVVVGAIIDGLITYGFAQTGRTLPFGYGIACLVAVWLICNEIISILENISDIGVALPPFLMKIVGSLKSQVESKAAQALPIGAGEIIGTVDPAPAEAAQTGADQAAEVKQDTAVSDDNK
ncbi:phage holin family protein [Caproiciproducens faecalis]|uniref:Phage holin family protein n=1 Tax=Caproiciproducens faecalis TaxID=2820301 RepID=A0ABS7DS10_9FIRM|nr:phage holin family protein [Caproiciproducens faecalis]